MKKVRIKEKRNQKKRENCKKKKDKISRRCKRGRA